MADFSDKMKKAWLKSMEAIGNTAGNIASNTRYKVNEMTLLNRRREILSDFGARAYDLWQKGEVFPEELAKQLEELSQVDIQLNALRMERLAGVKNPEETDAAPETGAPEEANGDGATTDSGEARQEASPAPEGTSPLADKANQALDTIGNTLKNVGSFLGGAINSVADTLAGKKNVSSEKDQPDALVDAAPSEDQPNADGGANTDQEETADTPQNPQPADADEEEASKDAEPPEDDSENPDEYKVE